MCWSGEASALLATAGLGSTAYVAYKGEDKGLWMPLGFFSLMELLQAFTYYYIDDCGAHMNHVLTVLGFIHIAFQGFFINAASLHFVPTEWREKIQPYVYSICFFSTVLMILKLYPFHIVTGVGTACVPGKNILCDTQLCSVTGEWHIAWGLPLSLYPHNLLGYYLPAFILPFIYGSWRLTLYHIGLGPLLVILLTGNLNERAAIWCLLSIGLLLIVIKSPIRRLLYVKKWYFWEYPIKK